jgi:predicted TIM-barrel fold metal-dependent hydrolase
MMSLIYYDAYTRFGPVQRQHGAHPWSFEHLLDELNHCSISAAMVANTAQLYYNLMFENLRLEEKLADYDWLRPIWNVRPHWTDQIPEPVKLVQLIKDHDIRAVTLHPKTNGWRPTSKTSRPLLDELQRAGICVMISYCEETDADEIEYIADQFPELKLLIHGVYWSQTDQVLPLILHHKQLHVSFDRLQLNYGLEWLVAKGCEDQLVFNSNAPNMSAGAHRFYVDYADLPHETKQKIAAGNLMRLIGEKQLPAERVNQDEDPIMAQARQGQPLAPLVIDMHAHILDEGLDGPGGSYMMINGGPKGTFDLAKRMGVDRIGLMSWNGAPGVHAQQGNQCVIDALDSFPDFYWGLGTFDTAHESSKVLREQMQTLYADKRFLGLKPYPQYGIAYDDPRYDVWWQFGSERGLYCLLHPVKGYIPDEFESICSRYPDLIVLAAHVGGSYQYADYAIELAKKYPNFYAEITYTPVCGGIIDYLAQGCGPDRVVYGSDLPMRDPRQQLGWVVYSRLSVEHKQQVLGGNADYIIKNVVASQATQEIAAHQS